MSKIKLPVTLVVPAYNRLDKTSQLLSSIADADFICETVIVDDNSSDDLESLARSYDSLNIRFIRNSKNMGPAYSRNVGISISSHPYVAFTDNDCIVTKDWLIRLYEYIRDAPSNVAGIGGRTMALGNDIISQYYEYNKILDPWFYNGKWLYIVSANAIFKKQILMDIEGFDYNVKGAGGEDVGLCFKINNKGYDLLYNDDAIIIHDFDTSLKKFWKTFFNYGYGCRIQYDKFYKPMENPIITNYAGLKTEN